LSCRLAISSSVVMTEAIRIEDQADLHQLREWVSGDDEAEAHIEKVLQAVSGHGGMHNATAILGDELVDTAKKAESYKSAGNTCFAEARYEDALEEYQKALDLFKEYQPNMLNSKADVKKLIVTCYCNSAQACLKLGEKGEVERCAESARWATEKALEMEPANVKARFRRGCAYALQKDWNLARGDFEWVLRVEPGNERAKQELREVLKHQKNDKQSATSGASTWQKAAAAMVSSGCEDPRIASTEKAAAVSAAKSAVDKQVFMASQLRKAVLKFYETKGTRKEWEEKLRTDLQESADDLVEDMVKHVSDILASDANLEEMLGPQGKTLAGLDEEQRRRYIVADAFVTTLKGACGSDFPEIVSLAATLESS